MTDIMIIWLVVSVCIIIYVSVLLVLSKVKKLLSSRRIENGGCVQENIPS
jgi:hypothetical protein